MEHSTLVLQDTENLWNCLLDDKLGKLPTKDQKRLKGMLNYETFQKSLGELLAKYNGKRTSKLMRVISPAIEGLTTFSRAIDSISQVHPFAALGWGVAQLLLEVRGRPFRRAGS
jgi:hypothetical protein